MRRPSPAQGLTAVATLAYVVLATRAIDEPGLHIDEAAHVVPSLAFAKGGLPTNAIIGTGPTLDVGGHSMNIMTFPLAGSLKNFLFVPVAALFDMGPQSVRYFSIALSALALVATYVFARRLFRSEWVAAIGVALLAVDPSFVFYTKVDFNHTALMILLKALAAWQFLRWWDTRSGLSLAISGFAVGLGVYDKANFVWIVAAAAVAIAVLAGRAAWERANVPAAALGIAGLVLGSLPLIYYNLRSGLASLHTFGAVTGEFTAGSRSFFADESVPGGGLVSQLIQRTEVLADLLDGSSVSRLLVNPFPIRIVLIPILFAIAAAAICVQLFTSRPHSRELRAGFAAVLMTVFTLAAAAATSGGFHGYHVILAYPFPHLALALVIVQAARAVASRRALARRPRAFAATAAVLTAIPVGLALATTLGMNHALSEDGGRGPWSDRIYTLERYLTGAHDGQRVVTADYGLSLNLVALSQGDLHLDDYTLLLEENSPPARQVLAPALRDRHTWYVLHAKDTTFNVPARRRLFATMKAVGAQPHLVRRFRERDGEPLYEIYSVPARPTQALRTSRRLRGQT
jgi:hypothetical protein